MARKEVVEMAPRTKPHHSGTQRKPLEGAAQPSTRRTRREGRRALESSPPPFQAFTLRERAENIRDRIASCIPQGEGAEAYEDLIPMAQGGCRIPLEEEDLPGWIDQAEQLLVLIRALVSDRRMAGVQQRMERNARDATVSTLECQLNSLLVSPQMAGIIDGHEDPLVKLLIQATRFVYETLDFKIPWVREAELLCDLVKIEIDRRKEQTRKKERDDMAREMRAYYDAQQERALQHDLERAWEEEKKKELFEVRAEELQEKVERPIQARRPKEASLSYEGRGRRHPDNRRDKWRRRSRMLWNRYDFEYRWWGGTKKNSF